MSGLFRFLTAGESHGEALVAVIDCIPAGLPLTEGHINEDLSRQPENLVALLRR
jgi:chorismate synthase